MHREKQKERKEKEKVRIAMWYGHDSEESRRDNAGVTIQCDKEPRIPNDRRKSQRNKEGGDSPEAGYSRS